MFFLSPLELGLFALAFLAIGFVLGAISAYLVGLFIRIWR